MNYVGSYRGKRWEADAVGRSVTISVAQPGPNARFDFDADPTYETIEAMAWTFMESRCDDLSGPTPILAGVTLRTGIEVVDPATLTVDLVLPPLSPTAATDVF